VEGQFFVREVPDEKLQLQYASLVASVIAFEGFDLFRLFSNEKLIRQFFMFLDLKPPLSLPAAMMFAEIFDYLLVQRPLETFEYLRDHRKTVDQLLVHINSEPLLRILVSLWKYEHSKAQVQVLNTVAIQALERFLKLSYEPESEELHNLSVVIQTILRRHQVLRVRMANSIMVTPLAGQQDSNKVAQKKRRHLSQMPMNFSGLSMLASDRNAAFDFLSVGDDEESKEDEEETERRYSPRGETGDVEIRSFDDEYSGMVLVPPPTAPTPAAANDDEDDDAAKLAKAIATGRRAIDEFAKDGAFDEPVGDAHEAQQEEDSNIASSKPATATDATDNTTKHEEATTVPTPLHLAVEKGDEALVAQLLQQGAQVNAQANVTGQQGATPLHIACRLYVSYRPSSSESSSSCCSHHAHTRTHSFTHSHSSSGHRNIVRTLVLAGADDSIRDSDGKTPLETASYGMANVLEDAQVGTASWWPLPLPLPLLLLLLSCLEALVND